jgi:hypothetical protein
MRLVMTLENLIKQIYNKTIKIKTICEDWGYSAYVTEPLNKHTNDFQKKIKDNKI